jgi:hypothetical protein
MTEKKHEHDAEDDWARIDERSARYVAMSPEHIRGYVRNLLRSYTVTARTIEDSIRAYANTHLPGCECEHDEYESCSPREAMSLVEGLVHLVSIAGPVETGALLDKIGRTLVEKKRSMAQARKPAKKTPRKTKR